MFGNTNLERFHFGVYQDQDVQLFTLRNKNGMQVSVMNFGAIITSIKIPSRQGEVEAVLGFDTFEEYIEPYYRENYPYFGAIIGRNAGRVKNASFNLNGKQIKLPENHPPHHLHGGHCGFDSVLWNVDKVESAPNPKVTFSYESKDGEQGYPGNLNVQVSYELTDDNQLSVFYLAYSDAPTVVNLTQHTYFNFNKDSQEVTNHKMQINASQCLPLNQDLIPFGYKDSVDAHNLDFREPRNVPSNIDDSFVREGDENQVVGHLECEQTGVSMDVRTSYPILHIYGGYYVPEISPKNRKKTGKNAGVCFEAQRYPDALNHSQFPSNQLNPGETYQYETHFKFHFE